MVYPLAIPVSEGGRELLDRGRVTRIGERVLQPDGSPVVHKIDDEGEPGLLSGKRDGVIKLSPVEDAGSSVSERPAHAVAQSLRAEIPDEQQVRIAVGVVAGQLVLV